MSLLTNIKENERPYIVPGFLRPIDTARIAKELNLKGRAEERGKKNIPNEHDLGLDAVEKEIVQKIDSEFVWQCGELINSLRAYQERLLGYSIPTEYEKLRLSSENALTRLQAASKTTLATLGPLQEFYIGTRDELDAFRKRNKITRPPRDPSGRWTTVGLLSVLISVEAIVNSFFFAKGSKFGLLGGVGTAIIISAANIVLAFLIGLWPMRWINHRNFVIKLFGLIISALGIAAIVALHAFAVHLREQSSIVGESKAFVEAIRSITDSPLNITDFSSLYLFLLGVLFGLGATWKGYFFDDPYPGYGATYRRMVAAREDYSEEHDSLFEELEEIKEQTVVSLQAGIERLPKFPQMAAHIRSARAAIIEEFRVYERNVETAASLLLAQYREINKESRSSPAPAHFNDTWRLKTFVESGEVKKLLADPIEEPADITRSLRDLGDRSDALLKLYTDLLSKYPHASEMK